MKQAATVMSKGRVLMLKLVKHVPGGAWLLFLSSSIAPSHKLFSSAATNSFEKSASAKLNHEELQFVANVNHACSRLTATLPTGSNHLQELEPDTIAWYQSIEPEDSAQYCSALLMNNDVIEECPCRIHSKQRREKRTGWLAASENSPSANEADFPKEFVVAEENSFWGGVIEEGIMRPWHEIHFFFSAKTCRSLLH